MDLVAPPTPIRPPRLNALPGIVAGFSTRAGGVSTGVFDSLNLGFSSGDDRAAVEENRRRLLEAVGFTLEDLALAGQVHGAEVQHATEAGLYEGYDGLVTGTPGLVLGITAADCAAVLLADPQARVVGACHSGWRGTVANICQRTVSAMQALSASPKRILAYISPCISAAHFEVGPEVAAQFAAAYRIQRAGRAKPHINLKAAIADQLEAAGVPFENIATSKHCTFAETEHFYSYRAENGNTGRMMGFIGMPKSV